MNIVDFDRNIFLFLNIHVGKSQFLDTLTRLIVNEYFIPVSLALLTLYIWVREETHKRVLTISALSVGLVNLIIELSNQFFIRPRPFTQLPTNLLFYKPTDPSFPSNAAAVGFALATSIFLIDKKLGTIALLLAFSYSLSRVYAGVHFPADVIVGALLGVLAVLFIAQFKTLIKQSTRLLEKIQTKLHLTVQN
ncbi:MAG: phosphatase PAP2 family protein [Candidatus Woykebacteria bacterium]